MLIRSTSALLCLALSACGHRPEPPPAIAPSPPPPPPAAAVVEPELLVTSANRFALDAYRRLDEGQDNCVISPISLWMTLAMIYTGARGETAAQLAQAMHLMQAPEALPAAVSGLSQTIKRAAADLDLRLVCAGWIDRRVPVKPEFERLIATHFGSPLYRVEMSDLDALTTAINDWASEATDGRITDLAEGFGDGIPWVVLANAACLLAPWQDEFAVEMTQSGPFTTLAGVVRQVPMMHHEGSLAYARAVDTEVLELPYLGGKLAMTIVAPGPGKFAQWEEGLDLARLDQLIGSLETMPARLAMPKWETRTSVHNLVEGMGLPLGDGADYSGIAERAGMVADRIYQQTWIAVNEQGTEAAAATMSATDSLSLPTPGLVEVTLNRPFLYLIRERASGLILFCGRVTAP